MSAPHSILRLTACGKHALSRFLILNDVFARPV
jgi:hypothetical protein